VLKNPGLTTELKE